MTEKTEGIFRSSDGIHDIAYTVWTPDDLPRAVVQIVHGMNEFVDRYDELANYLAAHGIVVCGDDHLGHGRTAKTSDDLGFFGEKDGDRFLVEDVLTLNKIMKKKYRSLPYILLGHSMGSFISRAYVSVHPETVDAFVVSGTAGKGQPFGLGKLVCSVVAAFRGNRYRSKLIKKLAFSGYNKRCKGDYGVEWVTTDPVNLSKYAGDPKSTFDFTVRAYHDMFSLLSYVNSDEWYDLMPESLPILFVAGKEDPVGNYSKGVVEVADRLSDKMSDLTVKLYDGERHELHTGLKRQEYFADLLEWINERIDGVNAARTFPQINVGGEEHETDTRS